MKLFIERVGIFVMTRQGIYDLINRDKRGDWASKLYDWYMLVMILASVVPLMFVEEYPVFTVIEVVTVIAFIIDYLLRWSVAPIQLNQKLIKKEKRKRKRNKNVREPKRIPDWLVQPSAIAS